MIRVEHLHTLLPHLAEKTILVVGDVMVDEYIWGKVSRISPEAPVPVVEVASETLRLGGAANVVNNLRSLGGQALLCSVIGKDAVGTKLCQYLTELEVPTEYLLIDPARSTTLKTRIIAHHQQVVRLDREHRAELHPDFEIQLIEHVKRALSDIDGVIIEDYGKGVITRTLVQQIVELASQAGKIVAVDPKTNHFDRYTGVTVITPNHHEAGASLQMMIEDHDSLLQAGRALLHKLDNDFVLITRGEEGMSLFDRQSGTVTHVPAMASEVYDVTGAGDTVIATLTLGLAASANLIDAVILANTAAGVVVGKVGAATVSLDELRDALNNLEKHQRTLDKETFV
jgi:rfaE bifunctional protein kinase chain/domain